MRKWRLQEAPRCSVDPLPHSALFTAASVTRSSQLCRGTNLGSAAESQHSCAWFSRGLRGAAGGPNTQACLEPAGWDHSPAVLELLPTSQLHGIGPGMPASRQRRQLGWQPVHSARAVSWEAGQAGLRPPPLHRGPGQATGTGPSFSPAELQGSRAAASPEQGPGM